MPSWKKVIISGSAAELSSVYAPSITGSLQGTASWAQNAVTASYAQTASLSYTTTRTDLLVINQSGFTINKGVVVRITGSNNASDIPRITTASYTDDNNSANTLGIASEQITNGSQGYVITEGVLTGLDTTGWTSGTLLFLGATGSITASAPQAPLHAVRLGQVIREQSNNGSIHVRIDNGYEIGELHDVADNTTTTSYGDLLVKSGSVWVNSKQLTGSYGLTGSFQATSFTGSLLGTASYDPTIIRLSGSTLYSLIDPIVSNFSTEAGIFFGSGSANNSVNTYASVFIGRWAGQNAVGTNRAVAIGQNAGAFTSGSIHSVFIGTDAGSGSISSSYSNFIGQAAGEFANDTIYANFIGTSAGDASNGLYRSNVMGIFAGLNASSSYRSNWLGQQAGQGTTGSFDSNFFGYAAGYQNLNAQRSNFIGFFNGYRTTGSINANFIGNSTGRDSTNASESIFMGTDTGRSSTGSYSSVYIGNRAGYQVNDSYKSVMIGPSAGYQTTQSYSSNFIGEQAGYQTTQSYSSNFIGEQAGYRATSSFASNFLGYWTGKLAFNSDNSNFIGVQAGGESLGLFQSNLIGTSAGYQASGSSYVSYIGYQAGVRAVNSGDSVIIGKTAGYEVLNASQSVYIGEVAGANQTGSGNSVFIGLAAGRYAGNTYYTNALGYTAGYLATGSIYSNFLGYAAGRNTVNSTYSNLIGYRVGYAVTTNSIGSNNIIIGTNITLSSGSKDSINIGGILFGTGSYSTVSGNPSSGSVSTGRIGIGIVSPTATLHVNNTSTGNSFLVEDTTNPDSTPFLIDNAGNVMIGTTSSRGEVTIAASGADGLVLDTDTSQPANSSRLFFKNSGSNLDISMRNNNGSLIIGHSANAGTTSGTFIMTVSGSGVTIGNNYALNAARNAILQVSGSVNIEEGFAYKQDGFDILYATRGTIGTTYDNIIGGVYAGSGSSVIDAMTAYGYSALQLSSGSNQTAVGYSAGRFNSGSNQTLVGWLAGMSASGDDQTAIGAQAGYNNISTSQTAIGSGAGYANTGSNQTAIGVNSGLFNSGSDQTALGVNAGRNNFAAAQVAIGRDAGYFNTGSGQTAVGAFAGQYNSGSFQTTIGREAGQYNSGSNQSVFGYQAGAYNSGSEQTSIGVSAGYLNTGDSQTATGYQAGLYNSGSNQSAFGRDAGRNQTGSRQSAFGAFAGGFNKTDFQSVFGYQAGQFNSGSNQSAFGYQAGYQNSGSNQTAFGYQAGYQNTGSDNSNFGYNAGLYTTGVTINTGSVQSVFIGSSTTAGGGNRTNQIVIGYNASGIGSNSVVLGNSSITTTALRGNVGINTTTPTYTLQIHAAPTASIRLQETGSGGNKRLDLTIDGSGTARISANQSAQSMAFDTVGNERLRITKDGDIGIGTSTPLASLHTTGSAIISGSLTIGSSSLGPNENTLTLGARDAVNEGGQLGLNAPGGTYTSASMLDLYQNRFRILKGTNAGSTGEVAWWDMHNLQMALPAYTSATSFTGTAAGYLAFDSSGKIITTGGVAAGAAGSNTEIQYNNGGALAGTSAITFDGTTLRATGSFTGSLVGTLTGTASFATSASRAITSATSSVAETIFITGATQAGVTYYLPIAENLTTPIASRALYESPISINGSTVYINSGIGTLIATASRATTAEFAVTASFITSSAVFGPYGADSVISASSAATASYVNPLQQDVIITGSLNVSGSYNSPAGNTIDSNALIQASLLYLSNNF